MAIALRIFIADDHHMIRAGLRALLEQQPGWTIVGEAADGQEAVNGILATSPEIAVLDFEMPKLNGLQVARRIHAHGSQARVLILSLYDAEQIVRDVIDSGARGYVLKSEAPEDLIAAIEAVERDQTFFTPKAAKVILERYQQENTIDGHQQPESPVVLPGLPATGDRLRRRARRR